MVRSIVASNGAVRFSPRQRWHTWFAEIYLATAKKIVWTTSLGQSKWWHRIGWYNASRPKAKSTKLPSWSQREHWQTRWNPFWNPKHLSKTRAIVPKLLSKETTSRSWRRRICYCNRCQKLKKLVRWNQVRRQNERFNLILVLIYWLTCSTNH